MKKSNSPVAKCCWPGSLLWMVSHHWIASPVCLQTAATLILQAAVHQEPGLGTRGSLSLSESIGTINQSVQSMKQYTKSQSYIVTSIPVKCDSY